MTPETKIKNKLKKYIIKTYMETNSAIWFKSLSDRYNSGLPDNVFLHHGIFEAFEVKAKGKPLTKRQAYELRTISNAGGRAYIVTEDEEGELAFEKYE